MGVWPLAFPGGGLVYVEFVGSERGRGQCLRTGRIENRVEELPPAPPEACRDQKVRPTWPAREMPSLAPGGRSSISHLTIKSSGDCRQLLRTQ
jgi:hypothetical protein